MAMPSRRCTRTRNAILDAFEYLQYPPVDAIKLRDGPPYDYRIALECGEYDPNVRAAGTDYVDEVAYRALLETQVIDKTLVETVMETRTRSCFDVEIRRKALMDGYHYAPPVQWKPPEQVTPQIYRAALLKTIELACKGDLEPALIFRGQYVWLIPVAFWWPAIARNSNLFLLSSFAMCIRSVTFMRASANSAKSALTNCFKSRNLSSSCSESQSFVVMLPRKIPDALVK